MESILSEIESEIRRATGWSIVVAIAAIICGAFAIIEPLWGAIAAAVAFGVVAIVAGVLELGYAWRTRKDHGAVWRFLSGIAYLVAGIWVLAQPGVGIVALSLALGAMLVVRGISLLFVTYDLRSTHVWGWYLFDGLVSLALGALVLAAWPTRSVLYLGLFFGAGLVINGWQRFMVSLWVRRTVPKAPTAPPISAAHA
jgi:uncharacterized membrane protein HdeD (DUF308 family)